MNQLDKQTQESNIIKMCKYLDREKFYYDKPKRDYELKVELNKVYGRDLETIILTPEGSSFRLDFIDDLGNQLVHKRLTLTGELRLLHYIHEELKDESARKIKAEQEQMRLDEMLVKELGIEL